LKEFAKVLLFSNTAKKNIKKVSRAARIGQVYSTIATSLLRAANDWLRPLLVKNCRLSGLF
jgi:hypothetical protein